MEFHITEDDIASVLTEALPFPVEGHGGQNQP